MPAKIAKRTSHFFFCLEIKPFQLPLLALSQVILSLMSAIGSLVFCTDCGNLLDGSAGKQNAILKCRVCGVENKGAFIFTFGSALLTFAQIHRPRRSLRAPRTRPFRRPCARKGRKCRQSRKPTCRHMQSQRRRARNVAGKRSGTTRNSYEVQTKALRCFTNASAATSKCGAVVRPLSVLLTVQDGTRTTETEISCND
jgi:DNA-directed RNA polymerase I subunit RPA12